MLLSVDIEKAFDPVKVSNLKTLLDDMAIGEKLLKALDAILYQTSITSNQGLPQNSLFLKLN